MFLLYKYKPVCSIHNRTYWLIITDNKLFVDFFLLNHVNHNIYLDLVNLSLLCFLLDNNIINK